MRKNNALLKVDRQLNAVLSEFKEVAKQIKFRNVCDLSEREKISEQRYSGVYRIDIKVDGQFSTFEDWMRWFKPAWDIPELRKKFTPTTKLKRIKKHKRLRKWMPIYIGKHRRIDQRVFEHINLGPKKRTFALKLRARGKFFSNNTFRLCTVRINVTNYDLLVPILERELRDRENPLVGRQ